MIAFIGFLPIMDSPVNSKVRPTTEGLSTLSTVIGFFSSMNSLVLSKVRFCAEDFKTLITFIELCSTMTSFHFYTFRLFFFESMLLRS